MTEQIHEKYNLEAVKAEPPSELLSSLPRDYSNYTDTELKSVLEKIIYTDLTEGPDGSLQITEDTTGADNQAEVKTAASVMLSMIGTEPLILEVDSDGNGSVSDMAGSNLHEFTHGISNMTYQEFVILTNAIGQGWSSEGKFFFADANGSPISVPANRTPSVGYDRRSSTSFTQNGYIDLDTYEQDCEVSKPTWCQSLQICLSALCYSSNTPAP